MKSLLFILVLVFTMINPYRAMSVETDLARQNLTVAEWAEMSPKEYAKTMGIKLRFKDRIVHRMLTRKARKAMKNGMLTGEEMAPQGDRPGWRIGFFLGIFTMAIGLAVFGIWGLLGGLLGIGLSVVIEKTDPDKWKTIEGSVWGVVFGLITAGIIAMLILAAFWSSFSFGPW